MLARRDLAPVLDDEALTRHLGDAEARILVEWLVERAEALPPDGVRERLAILCRRARGIARFVRLWCLENRPGAAAQLAAAENADWPLPDGPVDAWRLMQEVVDWEDWKRPPG